MLFVDDAVATAPDPQRDKCVLQKTIGCTKQPLFIKLLHLALSTPEYRAIVRVYSYSCRNTQTNTRTYVQTSVCIMYVAWPDKINAETVHKTFTFYYQPEREKERERVRESEIDKPQQAILNNNRIWWQRRGGVGHCLSTLAHKYA